MDFKQLKDLMHNKKKVPNLLIFTGEEKEVQNKYLKQIDPNYKRVDNAKQLPALMQYKGLLGNTTYVTTDTHIMEIPKETILNLTKNKRLIIVLDKIDKRSKFYKDFKNNITEFRRFTEQELIPYIKDKLEMTSENAIAIAIYCDNEIMRIDNELDKLQRLQEEITLEVIKNNIVPPLEDAIFEMIDSTMKKDAHTAITILEDMLELGESPIKIISLLYTKVRNIFMVQSIQQFTDKEIADKTGIGHWQVRMTKDAINIISLEELIEKLQEIQKYEVYMKTGQVDPKIGINYIMMKMI